MNLHVFQERICREFADARKSHQRIVIAVPTGGGKTVIAIHGLVPVLPHPVLWITHRRELRTQAKKHKALIEVQMVQSYRGGKFKAIIIDEAHHCSAEQYSLIFRENPSAVIVALTATPYRMDGVGLGSCGFTKIINGPSTLELTEIGVLAPSITLVPKSEQSGSWTPSSSVLAIKARKFHKAIVYCRTVDDAVETSRNLTIEGISASCIHGNTPADERERIERKFRSGKLRVLCNHTIFTEGYDLPEIDMVVLNRSTDSRCLWKQMAGRGLRRFPGKKRCIILDLAGNSVKHGNIYDTEIYSLDGSVESILPTKRNFESEREATDYEYNNEEQLKIWKPQPKPISIIESLHRLKSKSPLLRLKTA